ncbi:helix-turn-helix domain-containing protein [Agrobacterium rhizogenes]|nr:helix-turn-helix domain-containing protein [Rhizobium rhizogenes]NTH97014.1 helix-turn-helix domain-containing protein [Rhizobium rhizogenes]NTJ15200.1 helix-turn-helix domain-containing protein [Rhizobium rhizogenes]
MGNNLKSLRIQRGWTHDEAASAMGVSRGQFIKLERGERQMTQRYIDLAAKGFGVEPSEVIADKRTTHIIGRVGAGAEAHFYAMADNDYEEVPMPQGGTDRTVGLEVNGDSIGPFFNQWLVFYDDIRNPVTPDLISHLCIVETVDGRVLVKKIMLGNQPNRFHLLSQTESPIENVELVWAAKVTAMTPR